MTSVFSRKFNCKIVKVYVRMLNERSIYFQKLWCQCGIYKIKVGDVITALQYMNMLKRRKTLVSRIPYTVLTINNFIDYT